MVSTTTDKVVGTYGEQRSEVQCPVCQNTQTGEQGLDTQAVAGTRKRSEALSRFDFVDYNALVEGGGGA